MGLVSLLGTFLSFWVGLWFSPTTMPTTAHGAPATRPPVTRPGLDWMNGIAAGQTDSPCSTATNPVVVENCHAGDGSWMLRTISTTIEGFAFPSSLTVGQPVDFYINTDAPQYTLSVYRLGYYGGAGARLMHSEPALTGHAQPDCQHNYDTGLASCSNWTSSYKFQVPADWVSGMYLVKLHRPDTGAENYFLFTLRDDERKSDVLFQHSYFTSQAYNYEGGKSTYDQLGYDRCPTVSGAPRAVAVSFLRPNFPAEGQRVVIGGVGSAFLAAEYPMLYWLEQQGYDVSYSTDLDTHQSGKPGAVNRLLDHHAFMVVGHDEYWSQEMRNAVTAARDAGVNVGSFSSNTAYWRVRLEADPYTGTPDSVMVVYKTTQSGPPDPSGHPTGTWRDPQGANDPENSLFGVQYIGDNDKLTFPFRVSAEKGRDPLYRHTDLQHMPPDTYADIGRKLIGWEWDAMVDNGHSPAGVTSITDSPTWGFLLQDAGNFKNGNIAQAISNATHYKAPSGAFVFASATNLWAIGLGTEGARQTKPDPYIQQITYNILAELGAQPGTPSPELIVDGSPEPGEITGAQFNPTSQLSPPVISNISTTITGDGSARVSWATDRETNGWIWAGTQPGHVIEDAHAPPTEVATQHSVSVPFPRNQVTYFRIIASDLAGNTSFSDEQSVEMVSSFPTRLRDSLALGGVLKTAGCWTRANPGLAAIGGALSIIIIVASGALVVRFIRRRRLGRSTSRPESQPN